MKITICGSMSFAKEMLETKNQLEQSGHISFLPERIDLYLSGAMNKVGQSEDAQFKIEHDLIKSHYDKINDADAILVLNYDKRGIKNYIGGNSLLEIGFAHVLNKKIFLLYDIPDIDFYRQEIEAVLPVILNGDLSLIN